MATKETRKKRKSPSRFAKLPSLQFFQLDIDFDAGRIRYSTWGSVRLRFVGQSGTPYFNLSVNEQWAARNVPVLNREGAKKKQETWFSFPLGNEEGERVRQLRYGYSLSRRPISKAPALTARALVKSRVYRLRQGTSGPKEPPGGIKPKAPVPIEGGETKGPKAAHSDFPNQECGRNECVPAAISNSLKFLNKKNKLGIPEDEISIDKLKGPTGWKKSDGCPDGWQNGKKNYVESENPKSGKKKYPIETSVLNQPTNYAREIYNAVRRGCDVEIIANHHCVAVTGAQQLKNGKYSFDLTHDPAQRKKKGEGITETVTYNPNTNTVLDGAPWIAGEKFVLVVIECRKTP